MYLCTYYDGDFALSANNNHTAYKCWILRLTWQLNKKLSYQGNGSRRLLISSWPLRLGVHYIDYIIKTERT